MNLIEAIKSGKRFRRMCWPPKCKYHDPLMDGSAYPFIRQEFLSEDWEIEEKKIEITHASLLMACDSAIRKDSRPLPSRAPRLHLFLEELGLE